MSETRARRVAGQIKKEISQIIGKELKDPRKGGLISVTDVKVSRDMSHAWVYISIYGNEAEKAETLQTLERATGFIRSEIGRRIRLRHIPEIIFNHDQSIEYGAHIESVLKSLRREKKRDE